MNSLQAQIDRCTRAIHSDSLPAKTIGEIDCHLIFAALGERPPTDKHRQVEASVVIDAIKRVEQMTRPARGPAPRQSIEQMSRQAEAATTTKKQVKLAIETPIDELIALGASATVVRKLTRQGIDSVGKLGQTDHETLDLGPQQKESLVEAMRAWIRDNPQPEDDPVNRPDGMTDEEEQAIEQEQADEVGAAN